jgi:hypothetical protein
MPAIVQINFPYTESESDLISHSSDAAPRFLNVDGLDWKIWLVDENTKTAGGIYLFQTREAAQAYASGPMVSHLKNVREGVDVRVFDTIDEAGKVTRAPV